jgi:hypothetical protein
LQGTALTYSLQDIIKERRFLNNPECVWGEDDYSYFILYDQYVLKFRGNRALTWQKIKELYEEAGMYPKIDLLSVPHPNNYIVEKKLNAQITELILNYGMAYYP